MTEFDVTIDRPRRSQKLRSSPMPGLHPRLIAAFVAAMMVFTYGVMFAKYGAFDHPVEYLYPAAFVILVLALLPGALTVGAFHALTGAAVVLDVRTMVVIVAISAVVYGWAALRAARLGQTPPGSAAD